MVTLPQIVLFVQGDIHYSMPLLHGTESVECPTLMQEVSGTHPKASKWFSKDLVTTHSQI